MPHARRTKKPNCTSQLMDFWSLSGLQNTVEIIVFCCSFETAKQGIFLHHIGPVITTFLPKLLLFKIDFWSLLGLQNTVEIIVFCCRFETAKQGIFYIIFGQWSPLFLPKLLLFKSIFSVIFTNTAGNFHFQFFCFDQLIFFYYHCKL